jgi:hypothetical protein
VDLHSLGKNLRRGTYKFDGDLLVVQKVCSLENYAEGTLSDFLANSIMNTNDIGG